MNISKIPQLPFTVKLQDIANLPPEIKGKMDQTRLYTVIDYKRSKRTVGFRLLEIELPETSFLNAKRFALYGLFPN